MDKWPTTHTFHAQSFEQLLATIGRFISNFDWTENRLVGISHNSHVLGIWNRYEAIIVTEPVT